MNKFYIREDDLMTSQRDSSWLAGAALLVLLFLGAIGMLFVTFAATAQTVPCENVRWDEDCIAWNAPTARTDGSTLAATDIASYQVERAPVGSSTWTALSTVNAPVQAYRYLGLKSGDAYQYRVSVTLKSGARSVPSEVKSATTIEPAPNPPVLKAIDATAYEIKPNSTGTLVATRIGVLAVGTACLAQQQQVGAVTYTRVPRVAVDMVNFSTSKNLWVPEPWARCGA